MIIGILPTRSCKEVLGANFRNPQVQTNNIIAIILIAINHVQASVLTILVGNKLHCILT